MRLFDRVCLSVGVLSVAFVVVVAAPQMQDRPWWVLAVGSVTVLVGLASAWFAVRRGRW